MALRWDYPFFKPEELVCHCGCGGLPEERFMRVLVTMREEANFPFVVSSGFRCPAYNAKVADSGKRGPHTLGLAVDVIVHGAKALKLVELALKHGMTGIGLLQEGPKAGRFVHIDCIGSDEEDIIRPNIWTYSLKEEHRK